MSRPPSAEDGNPILSAQTDQYCDDLETYLLLLLSDSNLPTGGFVASSGLESFHAHGFLHKAQSTSTTGDPSGQQSSASRSSSSTSRPVAPSQAQLASSTLSFAKSTLHSYSRSSFPFLSRVHAVVTHYLETQVRRSSDRLSAELNETSAEQETATSILKQQQEGDLQECLAGISWLDYSYHTLLLNHVARRASKAQGIALLTLYSKAFAKPINLDREAFDGSRLGESSRSAHASATASSTSHLSKDQLEALRIETAAQLVDRLKMDIRRSAVRSAPQLDRATSSHVEAKQGATGWVESRGQHGHLPICWAVFAACLGISLRKALYLHLFLQARSLFSSSIRLNTLGPYLAHQIMRFQLKGVIDSIIDEMEEADCCDVPPESQVDTAAMFGTTKEEVDDTIEGERKVTGYTIQEDPMEVEKVSSVGKPFRNTKTMLASPFTKSKVQSIRSGKDVLIAVDDDDPSQGWAWDWPEDEQDAYLSVTNPDRSSGMHINADPEGRKGGFWTSSSAPATTFPLGEIVQARHDQLHSRLFNS